MASKMKRGMKFIGLNIAKGSLQAIGGIAIYLVVLYLIMTNFFSGKQQSVVNDALMMRNPGMHRVVDREGNVFETSR